MKRAERHGRSARLHESLFQTFTQKVGREPPPDCPAWLWHPLTFPKGISENLNSSHQLFPTFSTQLASFAQVSTVCAIAQTVQLPQSILPIESVKLRGTGRTARYRRQLGP